MKLIRLALTNFRQHAETVLDFRPGLTGIIGPNGAGKTTILEALAWAIYGTPAVRGTKDTLRFNRAAGRATVRAELAFELAEERYRVVRTPGNAELYRDEGPDPIAAGLTEVTRQLTRRLGMEREEFFNTYFTGQKELQFLAAMTPAQRGRFLSQVLGYERIRKAQELARARRNELKGEVEALRNALGDREELVGARAVAGERLERARKDRAEVEQREAESAARLAEVEPEWSSVQEDREHDARIESDLRVATATLENARQRREEAEAELLKLAADAEQLEGLREEVRPLAVLREEDERLRALAESESRRRRLEDELRDHRGRADELMRRVAEHEKTASALGDTDRRIAESSDACRQLEEEFDALKSAWLRDKQDADTRLRTLREEAEDLQQQMRRLESAGPDGVCPTCQRPLDLEYHRVLDRLGTQYEEVVADGTWLKSRLKQLESPPEEVRSAESALSGARADLERAKEERSGLEAARINAEELRAQANQAMERAKSLAGEVATLPAGYDQEHHGEVRRGIERLTELERRVTQLETRLEAEGRLKRVRAEAGEEEDQVRARMTELHSRRAELGFSEERYVATRARFEEARAEHAAARIAAERATGELDAALQAYEAARRAEDEYRERAERLEARTKAHRLHNYLDGALGQLREELNDRVRPELSEIASVFLTDLTDGRYNQIAIDDDYGIVVLDDGEEKPVISGGEEDLANLVLRLAISQMIADRAGQTLSLLVFDEVFGGLDDLRRESVVRLLQRLQDRFEQVILITHIESIREGMDHVIRVAYDERTGASVVGEESPGASAEDIPLEDFAALVTD